MWSVDKILIVTIQMKNYWTSLSCGAVFLLCKDGLNFFFNFLSIKQFFPLVFTENSGILNCFQRARELKG